MKKGLKTLFVAILIILSSYTASSQGTITLTFEVDMSRESGTPAPYITGDFNGFVIEAMTLVSGNRYSYSVDVPSGSSGKYFYLSGDSFTDKEDVPGGDCGDGNDRFYTAGTTSETISSFFSSCTDPTETTYTVSTTVDGTGEVSISPSGGIYNSGDEVVLTATAGSGQLFTGWSGTETSTTNPLTLTMEEDEDITATFSESVTLTFEVDMSLESGTPAPYITGDFNGFVIEAMTLVSGNRYSYSVDVPSGSSGKYFYLSGDSFTDKEDVPGGDCGDGNDRFYTAGTTSETISSFFSSCTDPTETTYTVSTTVDGTGEVSISPSGGIYNSGDEVVLTATAGSGQLFTGWSGTETSTTNPLTLTMEEDEDITATFSESVTLTFEVDMSLESGTPAPYITGDFNGFVIEAMTLVSDNRYSYSVDVPSGSSGKYFYLSGDSFTDKEDVPGGDCGDGNDRFYTAGTTSETISSFFSSCTDPTETTYTVSTTVDGTGEVSISPSGGIYNSGDEVVLTATAGSGQLFTGWSGTETSTTNPLTLTMEEDEDITATFSESVTLTFEVDMSLESGTPAPYITGDFNGFAIEAMTLVSGNRYSYSVDVPSGSSGKYFYLSGDSFSDKEDVPGSDCGDGNDRFYTVGTTSETISSFFSSCTDPTETTYTVSTTVDGTGEVSISPSGGIYNSGDEVVLTATAGSGQLFTGWSGTETSTTNPLTLTMEEDEDITATFSESVTLTFEVDMSLESGTPAPYITGDFNGFAIEAMTLVSDNRYSYSVDVPSGSSGKYFYLSGDSFSDKEDVPGGDCGDGNDRFYTAGTISETISSFFSSCTDPTETTYTVSTTVDGTGEVSISPSGGIYNSGDEVVLTATAGSGQLFTGWSGTETSTTNPLTLTMEEDENITATFSESVTLTFEVDMSLESGTPAPYITGDFNGFAIEAMTLVSGNRYSYSVDVPSGSSGKYFYLSGDSFSNKEDVPGSDCGDGNDRFYTVGTTSETISSFFSSCTDPNDDIFFLNITIIGEGAVSPDIQYFENDTTIELVAIPSTGNVFHSWSGDLDGTSDIREIVIDGNKNVTANFQIKKDTFLVGADMSSVNELEDCGVNFLLPDDSDPYSFLKNNGGNILRVRLWHTPSSSYSGLDDVKRTIGKGVENDQLILLNFHLSDSWADPGHQKIPAAWENVNNIETLSDSLYNYIYHVLTTLNNEGLVPDYVQLGNETNGNILVTDAANLYPIDWERNNLLFTSAFNALDDFQKTSGKRVESIVHIAQPENAYFWFQEAQANNFPFRFDIIGFSYYPGFSEYDVWQVGSSIAQMKASYQKEVMMVETAYGWVESSGKNYVLTEPDIAYGNSFSPESQALFLSELAYQVKANGGLGMLYWEPFLVSSSCTSSAWENATLFDFEGSPQPGWSFMTANSDDQPNGLDSVSVTFTMEVNNFTPEKMYLYADFEGDGEFNFYEMSKIDSRKFSYNIDLRGRSTGEYRFALNTNFDDQSFETISCSSELDYRKYAIHEGKTEYTFTWGRCEKLDLILSVNNGNDMGNIEIYPNPASTHITLAYPEGVKSVSLYSLDGELLKTFLFNQDLGVYDITLPSFMPKGLYLLEIINMEDKRLRYKAVKN